MLTGAGVLDKAANLFNLQFITCKMSLPQPLLNISYQELLILSLFLPLH